MTSSPGEPVPTARTRGLSLGRWGGVPIVVDVSWLFVAAYVTLTFVEAQPAATSTTARYAAGLVTSLLLGASILLHELGHALVATRLGMQVRRIRLFLIAGVTEYENTRPSPANDYSVALAGPLVSIALAALTGVSALLVDPGLAKETLRFITVMNVGVAVFNLIPGLPLDGGQVLRSLVWHVRKDAYAGTRAAAVTGRVLGALMIAVPAVAIARGRGLAGGSIVFVLIGGYISIAAGQALVRAKIERVLPGLTAGAFVRPLTYIDVRTPVSELVRRAQTSRARAVALTDSLGRIVALVDEDKVTSLPAERRAWITADEVSQRLEREHLVDADCAGAQLLERLRLTRAPLYLVMRAGRPVGMLVARDVTAAVQSGLR